MPITKNNYTIGGRNGWYFAYATDLVGQRSEEFSIYFDDKIPEGALYSGGTTIESGSYINQNFSYTATDNESGIAKVYIVILKGLVCIMFCRRKKRYGSEKDKRIVKDMIYNTVQDNKYLESAIGVFDSRYGTAGKTVEDSADKHNDYRPQKNKAIIQPNETQVEDDTPKPQEKQDREEITNKIYKMLEEYKITDIDKFFEVMAKKNEAEM